MNVNVAPESISRGSKGRKSHKSVRKEIPRPREKVVQPYLSCLTFRLDKKKCLALAPALRSAAKFLGGSTGGEKERERYRDRNVVPLRLASAKSECVYIHDTGSRCASVGVVQSAWIAPVCDLNPTQAGRIRDDVISFSSFS